MRARATSTGIAMHHSPETHSYYASTELDGSESPTLMRLKAELVKAQEVAREAATDMQLVHAQETLDALYDRIELEYKLSAPTANPEEDELLAKVDEILDRDERFDVTPSWMQITLHEL